MPEICEVTLTSQYLQTKLLGRYITGVRVVEGRYTHEQLKGIDLICRHRPLRVLKIDSKGKFMWFELEGPLEQGVYILNNFGMTGEWSFKSGDHDRVVFDVETEPDNVERNKHYKLYYSDSRNFGLLEITTRRDTLENRVAKLAPDLLKTNFTDDDFVRWVRDYLAKSSRRRSVPIVRALLRQDKKDGIASGIGNYLSSEVLYRAGISPHTAVGDLTEERVRRLAQAIRYIVKQCYIDNITGYMVKLETFLPKHREKVKAGVLPEYHPDVQVTETFHFRVYGREEDDEGNAVVAERIEPTRTTYWVPAVQS